MSRNGDVSCRDMRRNADLRWRGDMPRDADVLWDRDMRERANLPQQPDQSRHAHLRRYDHLRVLSDVRNPGDLLAIPDLFRRRNVSWVSLLRPGRHLRWNGDVRVV
jgi:hypothetical protein